jgi:predicted phage-related endonuclease
MWITGHPVCIFAVLHMAFGRVTFRTYQLHRDPAEIDRISTECRRFWHDHVLTGEPPAPDGHKATTAALKLWEADDDMTVELDTPTVAALERLHNLKAQSKDLDAEIAGCENTVKAALNTATTGVIAGRPAVTWKPQTATRIDSKALRASHPEIADKFSTTTESRVLRLKTFAGKDDQP